jgi:hypothetical protein
MPKMPAKTFVKMPAKPLPKCLQNIRENASKNNCQNSAIENTHEMPVLSKMLFKMPPEMPLALALPIQKCFPGAKRSI